MKKTDRTRHPDLLELRELVATQLGKQGVVILPPMDIEMSSQLLLALGFHAQCCAYKYVFFKDSLGRSSK